MKRRIIYFSLSGLCFIICYIIVRSFSGNPVIRGFLGDIVIVLLIYNFLKGIRDFNSIKLVLFTLALSYTTEFLQYLQISKYLGLENNLAAQLIIGSVFDPLDLLAYTTGGVMAYLADKLIGFYLFR